MNAADQETLTRVGPGTPMGELFRRYWLPLAMSAEHPTRAAPRRLTRLGERLVLARLPDQRLVLTAEACPHRGASLGLGRVESGGLRCVYHGWLFAPDGQCLEQPNERPSTQFCAKVRARAYPTFERGGVIWAYLGPEPAPPRPTPEWSDPDAGAFIWAGLRHCNWLQALEGDLDSSHIGILHARWDDPSAPTVPHTAMPGRWAEGMRLVRSLGPPRLEVAPHRSGLVYTAARALPDGREYHRVHPFLAPCFTTMGGWTNSDDVPSMSGKAWIPIDDTTTWVLEWQHRPGSPWTPEERQAIAAARSPYPPGLEPGPDTDYGRDLSLEVDRQFFGVLSNPLQDRAVVESMGPIADRAHEHLGPADLMIIATRRLLLDAARALGAGATPPGLTTPEDHRLRPAGALLDEGVDWLEATRPARERAYAPPTLTPVPSDLA